MSAGHPVSVLPNVLEDVKFVLANEVPHLPVPWPRSQDLPGSTFGRPRKHDLVLAVSHAWAYAAHPDPLGAKAGPIQKMVDRAIAAHGRVGKCFLFYDFLSTPQRPFARGQPERTAAEEASFARALRVFPDIYFHADAVLHVDILVPQVPGDGAEYEVCLGQLDAAKLCELRTGVHVMGWRGEDRGDSRIAAFDRVSKVGNRRVGSLSDLAWKGAPPASGWQRAFACGTAPPGGDIDVEMQRMPFGAWSPFSASEKGWVYLERFVTMVKGAMVNEDVARQMTFATSAELEEELLRGSARLREAARAGRGVLSEVLADFVRELRGKAFQAVSVDKAVNTGGIGGAAGPEGEALPSDSEVVVHLMTNLTTHLLRNWEAEERAQQQRQFTLAIYRGDVLACRDLLKASADPNVPDEEGLTCLHAAARGRDPEIVKVLLEYKADPTCRDVLGNCPAHYLGLFAEPMTLELFGLLAPSSDVLELHNDAGVCPIQRLSAWAETAVGEGRPYTPATNLVAALRTKYRHLRVCTTPRTSGSSLASGGGQVQMTVEEYVVRGRRVPVVVWRPACREPRIRILYIAWNLYMPWPMQQTAAAHLAEGVCAQFGAELFVCNEESLWPGGEPREELLGEWRDHMSALVEVLPLGKEFFLIENCFGAATPLLWEYQSRIKGALVLNPTLWFKHDFVGSEAHSKLLSTILGHARDFVDGEVEGKAKAVRMCTFMLEGRDPDALVGQYREALRSAPGDFWRLCGSLLPLLICDMTRCFESLGPLPDLPVVLACGAHSPGIIVQDTVVHLRKVMEKSSVQFLASSKQWWEVEGVEQMDSVLELLVQLLLDHAGSGSPGSLDGRPGSPGAAKACVGRTIVCL